MTDFQFPAVIARELRAGTPQIKGTTTSVGAFVGRSIRGPYNIAVKVGSFAQFQRIFGTYDPNSYLAESVDGFFKNGGNECWVVRVPGTSAGGAANTKAAVTIKTAASVNAVTCTAYSEGTHGNSLKVTVAKVDLLLGKVLNLELAASSQTEALLTAAGIAKVKVGDTLLFKDSANVLRIIIKQISGRRVLFSAAETPSGVLTTAGTDVTVEMFDLTVYENLTIVKGPYRNMRMSSLSLKDYFVTRINTVDTENVITATDAAAAITGNVDNRPVNTLSEGDALTAGDEFTTYSDATFIGSSGAATGFYALDKVKTIRLVACPGNTGTSGAITKAGVDYCANRQDCFFIGATALSQTPAQAATFKTANIGESSFAALYYPWFEFLDPLSSSISYTPPEGYVMGMYARTARERGLQKSPAGEVTGRIAGVTGVERVLSDLDKATVFAENINMVLKNDTGTHIMGARTLEKGEFEQIHKRLIFMYVRVSLHDGTTFIIEEPNTDQTRALVKRACENFLDRDWRKGMFDGNSVEEAFFVNCSDTNNPPVIQQAQQMVVDVGLNVPNTTEFLIINIQQDLRGGQRAA